MATKLKTVYVCQNCGIVVPKWTGKCNACGQWNTFVEEVQEVGKKTFDNTPSIINISTAPQKISEISSLKIERIQTPSSEFNRVLGGGIVPGSLILLGGEPGIGKSTLLLQIALSLNNTTLYISGEESPQQIKLRADRIKHNTDNCMVLADTQLESIVAQIESIKPELVIIDSIQTLQTNTIESTPGTISQIRECTNGLLKVAKHHHIPIIIVGHITKDGNIAGPKILEHMVDVVLQFEGDTNYMYRIIRSIKNRFGSTSEIGIFEMLEGGLREVANPSELLLTSSEENLSGVAIAASVEGIRPILVEIQALVSTAAYGVPQRSSNGFDLRRLNMLLAILEKRVGFKLVAKDVFINIAGGLKISDPALDLAVISAVLSSSIDIPISQKCCFAAELSLTGEIRPVARVEQRIQEAEKLGFTHIFISGRNSKAVKTKNINVMAVNRVEDVFRLLFKKN